MQNENENINNHNNQQQIQNNANELKDLETNLSGLLQEYALYQTQLQTATTQENNYKSTDTWVQGGGGTFTSGNIYVNNVDNNAKSSYINKYNVQNIHGRIP